MFHKIFNDILGRFYGSLDRLAGLKYEHIAPFIEILEEIMRTGLLESYNIDVNGQIAVLADPIRTAAMHEYTDKKHDEFSQPGVNRALPLLFMTDYLEKQAKLLEKRFPEPLLGWVAMLAS